ILVCPTSILTEEFVNGSPIFSENHFYTIIWTQQAVPDNIRWKRFGSEIGVYISIGILIYLLSANGVPSLGGLRQVVRSLPAIIIFAVINAFYEELVYRASFLSVLESVVGQKHALAISTLYFGIGHYYGAPAGIIGIIMASFLGYIECVK